MLASTTMKNKALVFFKSSLKKFTWLTPKAVLSLTLYSRLEWSLQ